ncbi:MAG: ester cyclase [Gemmatimonadota bacterium]
MRPILLFAGLTACGTANADPGDPTFDVHHIDVGHPSSSVLVADHDGDGALDLLVSGGGRVTVLLGDGSGEFSVHEAVDAGEHPVDLAAGDLDRDGRMDLVTANDDGNRIAVLLAREREERQSAPDLREVVERIFGDGWSRGDVTVFSETVADTVRFDYAGDVRVVTREELTSAVIRWRKAFPDLTMAVDDVVVEGDRVAVRATLSGTHEAPWLGVDATGEHVEMAVMMFLRFEEGRMVELWEVDDQLGLRRQLGIVE